MLRRVQRGGIGWERIFTRMGSCAGTEDLGGVRGFILRGILGVRRIISVRGNLVLGGGICLSRICSGRVTLDLYSGVG